MRVPVLATLAIWAQLAAAAAQTSAPPQVPLPPPAPLAASTAAPSDGIILGSTPSQPLPRAKCVDVEIGGEHAFGCLNEQLKRQVERVNPGATLPPLDARSQDISIGLANTPAVQQQYGQNYGRSIVPYRPPPPVYSATWAHH